jgi:hypothetical protein
MQTKHKVILGITTAVAIVVGGFVYSQGPSFQGALTVREDRDRDGMRDLWETQYGLNTASNDAASDLDGDGLTNRREYILRTYPNDTDSDDGTVSDGDEVTNGTDPLDGSDDVAVSLPDLVANEAATTFSVSGEVLVNSSGEVWSYDVTTTTTCEVLNDGSATASGPSYQDCDAYETGDYSYIFGNPQTSSEDIDLAPGEVVTFDRSLDFDGTSDAYVISFLQTLYDSSGSISVTILYKIDNAANSRVITESDETNNTPSYTLSVDDSLITWTVQEEADEEFGPTSETEGESISITSDDFEYEEESISEEDDGEDPIVTGSGSASRSTNQYNIAFVDGEYQMNEI